MPTSTVAIRSAAEKPVDRAVAEVMELCDWESVVPPGAAVVVKPAGSASIRGTDSFKLCHEVAGRVNGGGHPKAAGCKPDIYDDMLDYAHHWSSRGAVTQEVILEAFREVARQHADEDDEGIAA